MYHWRDDLWKNMVDSTKKWERIKSEYSRYIKTEKRLSENTVAAYMRDFEEFMHYILRNYGVSYESCLGFNQSYRRRRWCNKNI